MSPPIPFSVMAYVALGSNLGNSPHLLGEAMEKLAAISGQPLVRSSLWRTSPVACPPDSPPFVNAVVGLVPRPGETPESLLAKLQSLERKSGRQPAGMRNAPRLLDLDLIAFGREIRNTPALTLPHPRCHLRRFVLQPLSEIAPALLLPGQTRTVAHLLELLPPGELVTRCTP